jgi:hypothetical protein
MEKRELPRLPQAQLYLKSAKWGFDELLNQRLNGYPFRFYLIGILASLRAVQHALKGHDRTLSVQHKRVIDEWWEATRLEEPPELRFIRTSRDLILKEGAFPAVAGRSEVWSGEGSNRVVTDVIYDLMYQEAGEWRDLKEEIRGAMRWCDRELSAMEAKLPPVYAPD